MPTPSSPGQSPARSVVSTDPADAHANANAAAAAPLIRQATADDAGRLADWLDAGRPLPTLGSRERRAMLQALLSRPEAGPCIIAELAAVAPVEPDPRSAPHGAVQGLLTVQLMPRLDLAGLAAYAAEWWCLQPAPESGAMLAFCADWLVDWCRAHGVRHLLLSPDVAAQAPSWSTRMTPLAGGLPHLDLKPAAKRLG